MSITTVTAAEDACLPTIGLLTAQLADAFGLGGGVRLDLSRVAAPDLSVLQLVQAARATAAQAGADFMLASSAGATLTALLERAGFLSAAEANDHHFWFHGDTAQ